MKLQFRPALLMTSLMAFCQLSGTSLAVLTVYEGFDYAANTDMNGLNGGTGWGAATWTGTAGVRQVRSPGANYPSLTTVGNKAFFQATTTGSTRMLPSEIGGTASNDTVWVSFLGQRDPAGPSDLGRFFSTTFYQGGTASGNERFSIGENSSNANDLWGVHFTSTATSRQEIAGDSIYTESFLLARVDYHASANDDIYLWGNYNISLGEPAIATAQAQSVGGFNLGFDRVSLRAGAASGGLASAQGFFDELRIGTAFADVTTNPTVCGPGDTDCNGVVDMFDFEAIRSHFRKNVTLRSDGDLVTNGVVDFADFHQWKASFTAGGGSMEGISLSIADAPEPTMAGILVVGGFILAWPSRFANMRRRAQFNHQMRNHR
jgi:hypothetical protein